LINGELGQAFDVTHSLEHDTSNAEQICFDEMVRLEVPARQRVDQPDPIL
jgi:hypothetical protein